MGSMLQTKNLQAELTEEKLSILKGIDLKINAGEIHALLGPNGSGKSSFGRVLLGDSRYEITEGKIILNGEDMTEMEPHERVQKGFFLSFQSPPEIDGVSAKELLYAAHKAQTTDPMTPFRFKKFLKEKLESMRLSEDFLDREINKGASGGERRKMEIVSMMILDPTLSFLDEIDSGIDVDAMQAICQGLSNFMKDKTKSLIVVSHTEKFLRMIAPTHVHILIHGKIVKSGGPEIIDEIHTHGFDAYLPQKKIIQVLKG